MTPAPDFDTWHRATLPARLATDAGRAAARDVRDAPPLAFRLDDGRAHRLTPHGDGLRVDASDDAAVVVELDAAAWRDFATEMATAAGLRFAGRVRFARGTPADLERWEPALRALWDGRPILDPTRLDVRDADGRAVDPTRDFTLDASDDALRAFLHATGYLVVRGAFAPDEIARLREVVAARAAAARQGDGRSWWAKRADGASVLCRLTYLGLVEPAIAAPPHDPRLHRLMALVGEPLRPAVDRSDGHSVVVKNPDVVEGLSDLPWHRDCGLGGHPVTCPALNLGIQLDAATAATGRLHFLPGSWRGSCHRSALDAAAGVAVDAAPGDLTVHLGDVLHAAPPPTGAGPGRRTLYLSCLPARAFDVIPPGRSYNDVVLARVNRALAMP